jgi:ABC-type multidrug transport system ATPase subunit
VTAVCDPRSHLHGNWFDFCLAASTSLIQINDPSILTSDWYRYDGSWRIGGTAPYPGAVGGKKTENSNMPSIARTNANAFSPVFACLPLDHSLTVGRQAIPGQVVLDHPNVSLRHAALDVADGCVVLRDLGGTNGTYVNGALLRRARSLVPGDRIDIGPFGFVFDGATLTSARRVGNAELLVQGISYDVPNRRNGGSLKRILDNASVHIRPGEFVGIIGANGTGKSTLINILAGREHPSEGSVRLNEVDLHASFQVLKGDIAFLPQQDVLHEQLTLRHALGYTARLRLPPDTTIVQRREAVQSAVRSVGLLDQLDQRIGALSGGQKKCAGLAAEILRRPSLLFLDEVTSGLDENADWEIMRLLRQLSDEGTTIVVITHTLTSAAEFCDKILCMGGNGQAIFFGAPAEALDFFAVSRLGDVLGRIDELGAEHWRARFDKVDTSADPPLAMEPCTRPRRPSEQSRHEPSLVTVRRHIRQGAILLQRNTRLLLSDRRTLVMAAIQSVLIGGLVGYAFGQFGTGLERVNAENALLLLLGLSAIWLGCNAASKEIVGDLSIYRREHDINLSTAAFIGAKFLVFSAFTILQLAVLYVLVSALAEEIPGDRLEQFLLLTIAALAGTAIGLLISAFANTRDQATTIVPLALVPQLVLAGVLVPKLPDLASNVAKVAVSGFWITEAMKSVFIAAEGPIRVPDVHTGMMINMTAQPVGLSAIIVAAHALAFLALAYFVTLLRHGGYQSGQSALCIGAASRLPDHAPRDLMQGRHYQRRTDDHRVVPTDAS